MSSSYPLEETKPTILESIDDERIFYITKDIDGYIIGECCDYYFSRMLSQGQFDRLIQELITLSQKVI